jgi:LysM repeat protein
LSGHAVVGVSGSALRGKRIMADLDALKEKYSSVLELIKKQNVRLDHLHVQDDKLFMQGAAPTDEIKNKIWNQIKAVDASYSDLTCELTVDSSLPEPAPEEKVYTVVAGDSLWKIAQQFLGNGALFPKIIEANPDKLVDEHSVIHPGDELKIPNA